LPGCADASRRRLPRLCPRSENSYAERLLAFACVEGIFFSGRRVGGGVRRAALIFARTTPTHAPTHTLGRRTLP
jgi:hypothetical protein